MTLTATVTVGSNPVTPGQINFCDAAADHCTDIHLLGTAQLTTKGTAALYLRCPGIGSHSYKAVFLGTPDAAAGASAAIGLTVGPRPPGPADNIHRRSSISGPVATNSPWYLCVDGKYRDQRGCPAFGHRLFFGTKRRYRQLILSARNRDAGTGSAECTGFLDMPIPVVDSGLRRRASDCCHRRLQWRRHPRHCFSAPHGGIAVSLGNGDGNFAAPLIPKVDSADGINAFGVGDFNGDGITDKLIDDRRYEQN